jgi:phosphatidylserine/phosphatidylglycerophosphate/cardiolipin synthase-like enzyme
MKKEKIVYIALSVLISIIFISCQNQSQNPISGNVVYAELKESGTPIEVYFCPRQDCEAPILNKLHEAKSSIHCAFFGINLEKTIDLLDEKSRQIDVKLVTDNENYKGQTKNIPVIIDDDAQYTHNKFCIIDKSWIIGGSFNPTKNQNLKDNNNVIIINSRLLAKNYEDEFTELWNKQFGKGERAAYPKIEYNGIKIENYFCPEDWCSEHVINQILSAKNSIYFMIFSFTSAEIGDAILYSNVSDIKGILDKMQAAGKYSQYSRLRDFGLNVKVENSSGLLHHKVFILDNETIITGSFNPTQAADTKNDENILIIHDRGIAEKYLDEFDYLFP